MDPRFSCLGAKKRMGSEVGPKDPCPASPSRGPTDWGDASFRLVGED